ncbi:MAG TPA: M20/M25/M40 family metallo-hydrolase, partial [Pirellulales bacterium]
TGVASHAGVSPEKGVSATAIAGLAIAKLQREGWLGLIQKDGKRGTSNIGALHGGEATNVVTPYVEIKAEARSHDPELRSQIVAAYEQAFAEAAAEVQSALGVRGQVEVEKRLDYDAFKLADDEPCVLAAEAAIRSVDLEPIRVISNGGLDANWTSQRGLPTVTMGCGQDSPHTVDEKLILPEFFNACRIALRIATGTENGAAKA